MTNSQLTPWLSEPDVFTNDEITIITMLTQILPYFYFGAAAFCNAPNLF